MNTIFKRYRFTSKLMIAYLLLTVVPITLIGYVSYMQYARSIESQVGKYVPRILSQANANIDRSLAEFVNLADLIYNSREVMAILRDDSVKPQSRMLQDRFTVESFLSRTYLSGNYRDVIGVFILSNDRKFANARRAYHGFDFGFDYERSMIARGQQYDDRGQVHLILPYESDLRFEGDIPYLLIAKQIIDVDNRKNLGNLYLAVSLTFIEHILLDLSERDSGQLWIMNEKGRIVYHTDPDLIGTRYPDAARFPLTNGSFKKKTAEGGELFSVSLAERTGWTLVHHIPIKELTSQTDLVRNATIVAFAVTVLVTGVISVLLAWNFTRPLNKLSRLMRDVQMGNFQVDLQIHSRDEVGMLAHRFNGMVKEIRNLIRENYQIEIKQKEAELYALQFQINPHFMYNTLETIAMSVEEGDKDKVVEMVTLLGRMLRFSLSNRKRTVPIAEEVRHAEDFLRIQKHRFEDALEYVIRSSVDYDKYETPKFILQPILENGIKYGVQHRKQTLIEFDIDLIRLEPEEREAIRFTVRDNGIGMSPQKLREVRERLSGSSAMHRDSAVGLANVHSRIVLAYGEPFGLKIDSREGEGTTTTIIIPALQRKEGRES